MQHRIERINSLIKEELGKIILKELEFPDTLVTLTEVNTSNDIDKAVVGVSVLCPYGTSPERRPPEKSAEVLRILNRNIRHLRYLLMKKINIKPMPQIVFEIDYGLEKAAEIEKLLLKDKIGE